MALTSLLALLTGCIAPEVVVSTIVPSDTASDTAPPDTPDTPEDTAPPDPEPSWDTEAWDGTLRFSGDIFGVTCDEQVTEVGQRLPADAPVAALCPTCTHLYTLSPSASAACSTGALSIPLDQPTLRGVLLGEGFAMVYGISDGTARLLDANGDYSEGVLTFSYTESFGGSLVTVTGQVTFPAE